MKKFIPLFIAIILLIIFHLFNFIKPYITTNISNISNVPSISPAIAPSTSPAAPLITNTPIPTTNVICHLTIQNNDPSVDDILRRYQIAFNTACPEIVARFALESDVAKNVVLKVAQMDGIAATGGGEITINPEWMRQNPQQVVGALIHELTHVIQAYPIYLVWFTEGMADYSRSIYGPADDDWSLPQSVSPSDSYNDGYGTAARFLHWLEQHTIPTIVDQLNHTIQTGQSFSETFQRLTGSTVDEEWSKYEADPTIKPFKRIPAPDN